MRKFLFLGLLPIFVWGHKGKDGTHKSLIKLVTRRDSFRNKITCEV
jgi:hypothetical protein